MSPNIKKETSNLQVSSRTILKTLLHWGARLRGNDLAQKFAGTEPPLRSELFSSDQMKQHMRQNCAKALRKRVKINR